MLHDISDHYPIYLTVSKVRWKRDINQRIFRNTSNVNIIALVLDLHETWDSLPMQYSELNVNEKFDFIVRSMKSLADTHMPVRKYTRREYKLKLKPWITQGSFLLSNIVLLLYYFFRPYFFRLYKRSKLLTDFKTYKQFRNRVTHVKDLAKRKYYEEQFVQNSRNSKRTWKLINDTFGKTKPSSFPQRLKVDGRVYSSTKLIADALNHSFVTSAHTNPTPTSPSKTTDTNIKKISSTTPSESYLFITNNSWRNTYTY